jgi:hypothetical protein
LGIEIAIAVVAALDRAERAGVVCQTAASSGQRNDWGRRALRAALR